MHPDRIVIIGAGQAGARAAEALRAQGFQGQLTLVGDELEHPYERPPLSKTVLTGEEPSERAYLLTEQYYKSHGIDLHLGAPVEAILAGSSELALADGDRIGYDRLGVCTGSRVRRLPVAGNDLRGLHYLRSLRDCRSLALDLLPGRRLVAIGGGFIGLEVASSAHKIGLGVTVIEQKSSLLDRVVPPEVGAHVQSLHAAAGIDVRLGRAVIALHGGACVEAVELDDGTVIPADVVAVGIGVLPNTELAGAAGAVCADGIVVNEYTETTLPRIYAAGDVTNHPNAFLGRRVRLESWQNAQNQAIAMAKNMLGAPSAYCEVPWFWSDQLNCNIQMVGLPHAHAEVVWRGDRANRRCIAFTLDHHRVTSAIAFDAAPEVRFARRLIESRAELAPELLRDASRSLKEIVARLPRPNPQPPEGETHERRTVAQ